MSDSLNQPRRTLLGEARRVARVRHYSARTEEAYLGWIRRFARFFRLRHPRDLGKQELEMFLSHLAVERKVSAATQNQAVCALVFLYRDVLDLHLEWLDGIVRAKRRRRLPVVLTRDEAGRLLDNLHGVYRLAGMLLYGAGLRLLECLRLRVGDVDLARQEIVVRRGKGNKRRKIEEEDPDTQEQEEDPDTQEPRPAVIAASWPVEPRHGVQEPREEPRAAKG